MKVLLTTVKVLCLITIVLLALTSVNAQDRFTSCAPAEKFIEIKVAVKILPATGSTPARPVWVLNEIPGTAQIFLTPEDVSLRTRALEILQSIRDSGVQIGVGRGGESSDQLEIQLADLDSVRPGFQVVLPAGLLTPPTSADQGQVQTAKVCLSYQSATSPSGIEIELRTVNGQSSPLPGIPQFKLSDAGSRFNGRPEGNIPVRLFYSQSDLADARRDASISSDTAAVGEVQKELLDVAASLFDIGVKRGLLNPEGKPLVDAHSGQANAGSVQDDITALYNLNAIDPKVRWAIVQSRVGVRDTTDNAPWIISVTGLQFAQAVDIDVIKSPVELEFDGSETEKKFDAKRHLVRENLRTKHLANFSSKAGHIITSEDIAKDQALLRSDKATVKNVGDITSGPGTPPPQDLIFTASRFLKPEKVLSVKLGVGYSPEEEVTGSIALDEDNFLGFGETSKLAYSGGPQTQKIRFTFDRPFANSETRGWHVKTLGVNVQYFSDNDTRFANLTPEEIEMNEAGSTAQFSVAYDSFSVSDHARADCLEREDRKRTRVNFIATPVFAFRDVHIKDDDSLLTITHIDRSLLPGSRTQTSTLSMDLTGGVRHDFRKENRSGAGLLSLTFNGRLQRGFDLFGADYRYNKVNATVSAEFLFGTKSWRDFLLRYNRVMSSSTRGTPIFELPRLGGPLSVRGMEEGEAIGRKLSADQFEAGINAMLVWNLITRKPVANTLLSTDCASEETGKLPFDVKNAYLKFFYDRGRIHDPDSFRTGSITRIARGYGVAIELRQVGGQNVNLSIGYAFSPDSTLHKSGTIYTGVSYSF